MRRTKRGSDRDIEARLRADRPEPTPEVTRAISDRVRPRRGFMGGLAVRWVGARPGVAERLVDAAARDPDEPADRLALGGVERVAVAQRADEGLVRHVLGVGAVAQAVGDVGVHPADQGLGIAQRVGRHERSQPRVHRAGRLGGRR